MKIARTDHPHTVPANVFHEGMVSIIGAGSAISKDIPAGEIAAGNPAKCICTVADYRAKLLGIANSSAQFDKSYTTERGATAAMKEEIREACKTHGIRFVE